MVRGGTALAVGLGLVALLGSARAGAPSDRDRPRPKICELDRVDRAATRSTFCLGCHDGTVAEATAHSTEDSHPIEVDYERARFQRPNKLRPASFLPRALPLHEGKMTCVTCHDGASAEPGRTAMPMRRSEMCFACHPM